MIIDDYKLLLSRFPRLHCPSCQEGLLSIIENSQVDKTPSEIKLLPMVPQDAKSWFDEDGQRHQEISYSEIEGTKHDILISTFFLECDRADCQEIVSTCGETKYVEQWIYDPEDPFVDTKQYYFPKFFHPAINLFRIPADTPENVKNELLKSFALFWATPSACGNSLRKIVERILDAIRCESSRNLHTRIESLSDAQSALKNYLMAVKWIGNEGSHDLKDLTHDDVYVGLQFIKECLYELFVTNGQDLNSIASRINKERTSPSRHEESTHLKLEEIFSIRTLLL